MMAWVSRRTGTPLGTLFDPSVVDAPMYAALVDEARAADDGPLHEILRVQCDLLYQVTQWLAAGMGQKIPDWRYPRAADARRLPVEEESPWLKIARALGG